MVASPGRARRFAIDGVLVLDKPVGVSSTQALQRVRRLLNAEKAGHTGTLDPLASGVLPLCFGAATKLAQAGLDADKRYLATLAFGVTTTTGDLEGDVLRNEPKAVAHGELVAACTPFIGTTAQRPPMHSALKHDGTPLYALARAGIEVERAPRMVRIDAIDVVEGAGDRWTIDVRCSKGTYIRTLAEAIGDALGCGAHLAALQRTASGGIGFASAIGFDALEAMTASERGALLLPADALVGAWPRVELDAEGSARFLTGLRRRIDHADRPHVRVYGPARPVVIPNAAKDLVSANDDVLRVTQDDRPAFLGIAHIAGGELIADRLLSPVEVARAAAPRASTFACT